VLTGHPFGETRALTDYGKTPPSFGLRAVDRDLIVLRSANGSENPATPDGVEGNPLIFIVSVTALTVRSSELVETTCD
jgi:hypothetical protein